VDSKPTVLQAADAADADRSKSEWSNRASINPPDAPTVRNRPPRIHYKAGPATAGDYSMGYRIRS